MTPSGRRLPAHPDAGSVAMAGPEPPPEAAAVFGDRLPLARRYADLLVGPGLAWGLLGPREAATIWERHLIASAVVAELAPAGARVLDVGAGAGLPGLPMALARPDLRVVLLEPMDRRVRFLARCRRELATDVMVVRGRAPEAVGRRRVDVVVARAVADLAKLAAIAAIALRPGGVLLAVKGATAAAELARSRPHLPADLGRSAELRSCGVDVLATPATVVRMVRAERNGR